MGFFDIFKNKKNKAITSLSNEQSVVVDQLDDEMQDQIDDSISNETIEEIKKINNINFISELLMKKMEKFPKLVDLLLKGDISQESLELLQFFEKLDYLPFEEKNLDIIEFMDFDEKIQQLVSLLNNQVDDNIVDDNYIGCYLDLAKEFETIEFHNKIESFISNIEVDLNSKVLTKTPVYSKFILYLPKSKNKVVRHNFDLFIDGNVELDEDAIIQMSYDSFRHIDESIIDKISKCKIIFSEKPLTEEQNIQPEEEINYRLVKYNHLVYVIEKSSLNVKIKEKLLYEIKNMYNSYRYYCDLDLLNKITPYLNKLDQKEIQKLTKEFELNIETYKIKNIEKPEFNPTFYIDEVLPSFNKASINEVIDIIIRLPEELKSNLLREPRILQKLNLPDNIEEDELKRVVFLLSQRLSSTTIDFVNSLNFDVAEFMANRNNWYKTSAHINSIISEYGVFDYVNEEKVISVADIIGHDGSINVDGGCYKGANILHTFENFFDKNGDEYHARSLGLLEYKSGEELIEGLKRRNQDTLSMKIKHIEDGKYIIASNGLHRFSVLRFHYLLDCMKKEKSEEELRELYKIPVILESTTNFKKTYCNYLIKKANPDVSYILYNSRKDEIIIEYKSGKPRQIINEEELLSLAIESVDMLDTMTLDDILYFYDIYNSFHQFVDQYIPNVLEIIKSQNEEAFQK